MLVGYARTSTLDQKAGLEAQIEELANANCGKIFEEQVSSVDARGRHEFEKALDFVREGDTLVVTKLDRLARSVAHLFEIMTLLESKGTSLKVLSMGVDTATATGRLMLTLLGGVAEFEREIMLERQREGIAKAKAAGKYKGRKPTVRAKKDEIQALKDQGMGASEIADKLGVGRASVYRILSGN